MDKSVGRDKRSKDKHHKKRPPVKSTTGTTTSGSSSKPQKEVDSKPAQHTPAPLIVYDDPYSRRPIESNWHSGKNLPGSSEGGSDSDDDQLRAADFEKLLQMPPSASGHFFLSTEKHWTSESDDKSGGGSTQQQYGKYFQIDTKQLNASLATIPLHERNGYPSELFSKAEIDSMKLKAFHDKKKYEEICTRLEIAASKKMSSSESKPIQPAAPNPPVKCLIGADAVPPAVEPVQQPLIPSRPMPCLIGPMALPPELRNNPNVIGSVPVVTERLQQEVQIVESSHVVVRDVTTGGTDSSVPIGNNGKENHDGAEAAKKIDQPTGTQQTAGESKEDIQQWLDDILDM